MKEEDASKTEWENYMCVCMTRWVQSKKKMERVSILPSEQYHFAIIGH